MQENKFLISLNGTVSDFSYLGKRLKEEKYDYIIAADGGANLLEKMDLLPDEIIGDLDSIDENLKEKYINKDIKFKKYKSEKDETDAELCIIRAKELGACQIDFCGSLGGRIDHEISNIGLLYYCRRAGIKSRIITEYEDITVLEDENMAIENEVGKVVSIIAINGDVESITLEGFKYGLDNYRMVYGSPIGISNIIQDEKATIKLKKGIALVIINNGRRI